MEKCWRTRGGRPIRLGNRPRRIPTETSRRIKASFTRVIDPTLQRINFTTLLGRRHPPGPHRRAGPHTGLSLAEEPESRSNSYLARECRGEEGPRGLSEDTDGVIDQRRKKDSEDLPPARSPKDSSWISSPRPGPAYTRSNLSVVQPVVRQILLQAKLPSNPTPSFYRSYDRSTHDPTIVPTVASNVVERSVVRQIVSCVGRFKWLEPGTC
ncbi:hypothetical protein GEV33_004238 [Tenebrio molitor]|uniref:Uncharacterized protein n=1 Tax=Tenebrio molitor TaxID=7067 RepID=A0A8J6HRY9_TENMO|nr:hypothetical protein GEV33_004238 [Tenebrio molitor]